MAQHCTKCSKPVRYRNHEGQCGVCAPFKQTPPREEPQERPGPKKLC